MPCRFSVVDHSKRQATGSSDEVVVVSPSKAQELSVKQGEAVVVIGRRRRATYARVQVKKGKKGKCTISSNMASNLRLRNDDKLKVVKMLPGDDEPRSGDMVLLKHPVPPKVTSMTFSPVDDSLSTLEAREGGDEISDEELMDRFVTPYLNLEEATVLVKKGNVLTLTDDSGSRLEFTVTHMELEGAPAEKAEDEDGESTKDWYCSFCSL